MSRTQWCCLTALLAVVMGLLCGPVAGARGTAMALEPVPGVSAPVTSVAAPGVTRAAGPDVTSAAGPAAGPVAGLVAAPAVTPVATPAVTPAAAPAMAPVAAPGMTPAAAPDVAPVAGPVAVVEAFGAGIPAVPGCGQPGDHDGEPAVPTRARAAYDQAPGLAAWGLPAATGALPAEPPPGIRVRAPVPATPTPVELSVLRV
ncbi:hypothetical protein [Streptomyces sp. NPDC007346]|uniref:hypothetical protein n=1 Tax=Streptomyces sp. NPDC007346 TaxID=3154682 RepID=UPI0034529C45